MNDLTLLREYGPAAPPPRAAVLAAARAALATEIAAAVPPAAPTAVSSTGGRLPRRRLLAIAGVAAAACAAAFVVVATDDGTPTSRPPAGPVVLAAFVPPSFPVSLRPEPIGLTVSYNQEPGGHMLAIYRDTAGNGGFVVHTTPPTGRTLGERIEEVTVAGRSMQIVTTPITWVDGASGESVSVRWQRPGGEWLSIGADDGPYTGRGALLALAATVVDEPHPVPLQLHVAPVGWSVHAFKDRVLTMRDDHDEARTMSIHVPAEPPTPRDRLQREVGGATGPPQTVTVQGRPADLVPTEGGWWLQAAFADGTPFVLQAPSGFTAADVVVIAEEASFTP